MDSHAEQHCEICNQTVEALKALPHRKSLYIYLNGWFSNSTTNAKLCILAIYFHFGNLVRISNWVFLFSHPNVFSPFVINKKGTGTLIWYRSNCSKTASFSSIWGAL